MWSFGFDGEIIDNQPGLRADGRRWRISGGKVWKRAGTGFRRRRWDGLLTSWKHLKKQNKYGMLNFQDRARRKGKDVRPDSKFTGRKRKDKFWNNNTCERFFMIDWEFVHSILQSRFMQIFSNLSSFRGLQTRSSFQRLVKANLRAELQRLWQRTNAVNWRLWMHIFFESASLWWRNAMPEWNDKSE